MRFLGAILLVVLSSGLTYMATGQFGGGSSTANQLSPEVQKYVDAKLTGSSGGVDQELQKLVSRVTEMENKVAEIEKVRANYEQLAGKSEAIESAIAEQRRKREDAMSAARATELAQLRNDIATICAGVTIKRVKAQLAAPSAATRPSFSGTPASTQPPLGK